MIEKGRQIFFQEKTGWHPSVAAPGDTDPSDATGTQWSASVSLQCMRVTLFVTTELQLIQPDKSQGRTVDGCTSVVYPPPVNGAW